MLRKAAWLVATAATAMSFSLPANAAQFMFNFTTIRRCSAVR